MDESSIPVNHQIWHCLSVILPIQILSFTDTFQLIKKILVTKNRFVLASHLKKNASEACRYRLIPNLYTEYESELNGIRVAMGEVQVQHRNHIDLGLEYWNVRCMWRWMSKRLAVDTTTKQYMKDIITQIIIIFFGLSINVQFFNSFSFPSNKFKWCSFDGRATTRATQKPQSLVDMLWKYADNCEQTFGRFCNWF